MNSIRLSYCRSYLSMIPVSSMKRTIASGANTKRTTLSSGADPQAQSSNVDRLNIVRVMQLNLKITGSITFNLRGEVSVIHHMA